MTAARALRREQPEKTAARLIVKDGQRPLHCNT
jgi:hypothetical protein